MFERWTRGDAAAGEHLFERHFRPLYRFFSSKVGDDAEDLVQRTFVRCLEVRHRMRKLASFRAFLFGVGRMLLLEHIREKQSARGQAFDPLTTSVAAVNPTPSEAAAVEEARRAVLDALQRIPMAFQVVLELHYWEGLSVAELADVIDIPQGTVKSRLARGREHLRQFLPAGTDSEFF